MKKIYKSLLFVAAAMTLAACNKVEVEPQANEEDFYYTFTLGSPETKSLLASDENGKFGAWEVGDQLGSAVNDGTPGFSNIETTTNPVTFKIYKYGGLKENDVVYTYYPRSAAAISTSAIPFTIPVSQSQEGVSFDYDAMPMVGEGFVVPASIESETNNTPVGDISLVNLGSVIDYQIYSTDETYATETVVSVALIANKAIAGSFTKNITSVKNNDESTLTISGYSETSVTTSVVSPAAIGATRAAASHVYMVIAPVDGESETGITGSVLVTTNKAKYTFNISTAQKFKRSGLKSFGLNLGNCQNRVEETTVIPTIVSKTISEILTDMGKSDVENGTVVNPLVIDNVVTIKTTGSGNNAKVYGNAPSQDWRIYANGSGNVIISVADGYSLSSVKLTYTKESGPTFNGPASGVVESLSGTSKTYTVTSAGHIRITAVEVGYVAESAKTPVTAPTGVEAIADEDAILVTWTDAIDTHIDHYLVTCTEQTAQEIAPGVESALFEGLGNGTYVVTVTAIPGDTNTYTVSTTWTNEANPIVISGAGPVADTYEIVFSEKGYSNGVDVTTVGSTGPFSVVFADGTNTSNSPKYYDSGTSVRMYDGNTLTVSSLMDIVGIEFEFDSNNNLSTTTGTYSGTKWSGEAKSIVFTSTGGQSRIKKMIISYINDGSYTPPTVTGISVEDYTETFTASETDTYAFDGKVYAVYSDESKSQLPASDYNVSGAVDLTTPNNYTLTVSATIDGETYSEQIVIKVEESTGGDTVVYTLTPAKGSNNSYAGDCDVTINGITWNVTGNAQYTPWRIGGKSISGVDRVVYSKTALNKNISKIDITHGNASSITVNSMTIIVSKNADFSSPVSTLTPTFAANSTITVNRPEGADWTNCYYKIVYNVTVSGTSNKFLEFTEAKFTGK